MGKKKIQKFTQKIWNIKIIHYTCGSFALQLFFLILFRVLIAV